MCERPQPGAMYSDPEAFQRVMRGFDPNRDYQNEQHPVWDTIGAVVQGLLDRFLPSLEVKEARRRTAMEAQAAAMNISPRIVPEEDVYDTTWRVVPTTGQLVHEATASQPTERALTVQERFRLLPPADQQEIRRLTTTYNTSALRAGLQAIKQYEAVNGYHGVTAGNPLIGLTIKGCQVLEASLDEFDRHYP